MRRPWWRAASSKLGRDGNINNPMTFLWRGQSGQPTWLWGSNDGSNNYVYNPSNFSVNYAASANVANSATRAVQDQHGNNISDAYLRKSDAGIVYATSQNNISLSSGSWNNSFCGLTIPAGVYVGTFQFHFNAFGSGSTTGKRMVRFAGTPFGGINNAPATGSAQHLTSSAVFSLSSTTTIHGGAYQNSGSTATGCSCVIYVVKIK